MYEGLGAKKEKTKTSMEIEDKKNVIKYWMMEKSELKELFDNAKLLKFILGSMGYH